MNNQDLEDHQVGISPAKWLDDDIWSPITPFRGKLR
jgi:hypothetical protein